MNYVNMFKELYPKKKKCSTGLTSLEFWALMVLFIWAIQQERKFYSRKNKITRKPLDLAMRKVRY